MNTQIIEDYVSFMEQMAKDNSHGYSQAVRSLYNISNPTSFDCSSLTLTAIFYSFMKNGMKEQADYLRTHCSYTGNMMNLLNVGFEVVARDQDAHASLERGDIELNVNYHVAVAVDCDNIVHARSSEGTSDTKDNSGNEIRVQPWYNYAKGWQYRLRFTGKGINKTPEKSVETKTVTAQHGAMKFRADIAGPYVVRADELNVRDGAGTNYTVLTTIPYGTTVYNFGYYTELDGSRWLLIQFNKNGVIYTGHASSGKTGGYLVKKV